MVASTRVRNVNGRDHCAACIDGWVELRDRRGMAPCKWCEQGLARWQRHPELTGDFNGADIIPPGSPGPIYRPSAQWRREHGLSPERVLEALPALDDDAAEVQRKQQAAEIARRQAEAEESAPQEPISDVGGDGQIPQHGPFAPEELPY